MASPGLRERKRARTRLHIADTAARLFAERGYENVAVTDVAREAEVAEQTVYNYFPTKRALVLDRDQDLRDQLTALVADRPSGVSPAAAIREAALSLVEELRSGPGDGGSKTSAGQPAARAPSHARSLKTPGTAPTPPIIVSEPDSHASKMTKPTATPEAQVASVMEAPPKVDVEFTPTHADAIWAQIAARIDVKDFLGRALTKVTRTAISGPNQLEVFFPPAYHGNKRHCEQPAALDRLEKVASEVAGQPVKVVFRLDAEAVAEEPKAPSVGQPKAGEKENTTTLAAAKPKSVNAENGRQDPAAVNDRNTKRSLLSHCNRSRISCASCRSPLHANA